MLNEFKDVAQTRYRLIVFEFISGSEAFLINEETKAF